MFLISPSVLIFLTAFFHLNCYSVGSTSRSPSVNQGSNSLPTPSTTVSCVEVVTMHFLLFVFFPTVQFFSHSLFSSSITIQHWPLFAVFPFHPSHSSQFYDVPIKICLQKFTLVLQNNDNLLLEISRHQEYY